MNLRSQIGAVLRRAAGQIDGKDAQMVTQEEEGEEGGDLGGGWRWVVDPDGDVVPVDPDGGMCGWIYGSQAARLSGTEQFMNSLPPRNRHRLREVWAAREGWKILQTMHRMDQGRYPRVEVQGPGIFHHIDVPGQIPPDWPEVIRNLVVDILKEMGS